MFISLPLTLSLAFDKSFIYLNRLDISYKIYASYKKQSYSCDNLGMFVLMIN